MARHKQPRELAELKGATRKHPERYRDSVPKSTQPFGKYPTERPTEPAACWFEISAMSIPGILTGADRFMVEIASNMLGEYRSDPPKFSAAKLRVMISVLARLGLSPTDRNGLGVTEVNPHAPVFGPL